MKKSSIKSAQAALEFVILIGALFFIMLLFLGFITDYTVDVRDTRDSEKIKDIAYAVQTEITIAASSEEGYERTFNLPDTLDSLSYNISILQGIQVWVLSENSEFLLDIPTVVGDLTKGDNTIRKSNGHIYLNVGVENDTGNPIITRINPIDEVSDTDGSITFTYQVADLDSGVTNCKLILDGSVNQSDDSINEGFNQYFYLDGLAEGNHTWTINCTDDSPSNNTGQPVEWDLSVALLYNDPPSTPDSILCDGGNCNITVTSEILNISCSGSVDPENDTVTYHVEAFYSDENFSFQKVEAESGSFSYSGGYGSSSNCICSNPSGNCIRDTTWSSGTWAGAMYVSGLPYSANRVFVHYCSENDGNDDYEVFSQGVSKASWTTSYEDNSWETMRIDDLGLSVGGDFEINCSRGTSSSYCRIDYVEFDTREWSEIGTHADGGVFQWNVSGYPEQTLVDLRCRATDNAGSGIYSSYYSANVDMTLNGSLGGGGGAFGETLNGDFNTSSYWSGRDWNRDKFESNPTESISTWGGNPDDCGYIWVPEGKRDEVGGYLYQEFEVTVNNPSSVTCNFDWSVYDYESTPNSFVGYVFLDDFSGEPDVGDAVWSSGELRSTTSWESEDVDCTSAVGDAGTYYLKLAMWLETDGGDKDGPYELDFDNAYVEWQE